MRPSCACRRPLAAGLHLGWCAAACAQGVEPVSLGGARAAEPPVIDGRLDEPAWRGAPAIDAFTQVDPAAGAAPTERTEVRLLYDADNLYIGVRCFDSEPDLVVARSMTRDGGFESDDRVTITLDTFRDRRNGYLFVVSAAGGRRDGLIEGTRTRTEWDGIWAAKTRVDDEGWTAEVAIPMKTLSFDEGGSVWGMNIERVISRKNEQARWASPSRDLDVTTMSGAGEITDLAGLDQGYGLTIKPVFTGRVKPDTGDVEFEPGLDVFYKITPSTTAALTINTDFAEAEVDERRVNLTRFPLFFPEKRDFFLEDSGIFEFGGIMQSPRPFHSRRIGIVGGEEKDILAGLRLTGRHEGLRFGLLDVQMQDDDELGHKNLGVLRLKQDVLEESSVGLIVTNGDPSERGGNQLIGGDFSFSESDALGGRVSANLWAMATHDDPTGRDGENDDPYAFGGGIDWSADPWSFFLFADEVGHDFNPALGFVQRPGAREFVSSLGYTWRPASEWIREIDFSLGGEAFTTLGWDVESAELDVPEVRLTTRSNDSVAVAAVATREVLGEPFEIVDGVTIPTGEYDNARWRAELETSPSRRVALEAGYESGGFYDGTRDDLFVGAVLRPAAWFALAAEYEMNDIDLESGDFIVRTARTRATLQFSPDLTWDTTVQWDNQSDQAGLNGRVRYEFSPGQELYVVYNEGFSVEDDEFESLSQEVIVKVGLTFRF